MVNRSNLIVCYIQHNSGGAYKAVRYAKNNGVDIRHFQNKPPSIIPMWLVSSMIISIIKFRFHVQSTAQLNYLLSTIVYVPDSKFTFNVANALLYSHRICRELSPPEIATSAPSENALWVFRMRINASCF